MISACSYPRVQLEPDQWPGFSRVELDKSSVLPGKRQLNKSAVNYYASISQRGYSRHFDADIARSVLYAKTLEAGLEVVETKYLAALLPDIRNAEKHEKFGYTGFDEVDYSIYLLVDYFMVTRKYTPEQTKKNKDGDIYKVPASCTYDVQVDGDMQINDLSGLQKTLHLSLNQYAYFSISNIQNSANCLPVKSLYKRATSEIMHRLLGDKMMVQLLNTMQRRAYVIDAVSNAETVYVKVRAFADQRSDLKGTSSIYRLHNGRKKQLITQAETVDFHHGDGYWLKLNDVTVLNKVKIGDVVMTDYKCGFMCSLMDEMNITVDGVNVF